MMISVQVFSTLRCCLRFSKIGCHVSNRNNQHNSLRDAIKCWPIDLSRTELIFLIFEELHLHNKTVVAKADGVIEDAGKGGAGEVAEGERWGEQAGYQALHLLRRQAFFNYKMLKFQGQREREDIQTLPLGFRQDSFLVQPDDGFI